MPPFTTLDPSQLRTAWQSCRREAWPVTFDACMADPLISRMIALYALHGRVVREAPKSKARVRVAAKPHVFDQKRRASGEREDD